MIVAVVVRSFVYRVGDAPVRYFLNVLEADRERFTDLRTVYTMEGVDELGGDADARWSTVAVQPITYPREAPDLSPHGVLWRDLEHLAEMLDRPTLRRREFAHEILSKPLDHATADDLARLDWLMRGKGDLWDIVIAQVEDPAWFKYFGQRELWQKTDPDWLIPQWFTTRWTSRHALEAAIDWCNFDRLDLVLRADQVLHLRARPAAPWYKPWNLLVTGNLHRLNLRRGDRYLFSMRMQVTAGRPFDPLNNNFGGQLHVEPGAQISRSASNDLPRRRRCRPVVEDQSLRMALSDQMHLDGQGWVAYRF